jgi:hypothetical protein
MEDKDVLSVSIFQFVVPRIRNFLLFLYREGVIASGIFWVGVFVFMFIVVLSPIDFWIEPRLLPRFLSAIEKYYFNFVKYICYISIALYITLHICNCKKEQKEDFYRNAINYAKIIVISFLFFLFRPF